MITIIRRESQRTSLSRKPLEEVVEMIRKGVQMNSTRSELSFCFTAEIMKVKGREEVKSLNGLCLLQVQNLAGPAEVQEAMGLVEAVPYTVLAFRGDDGRSLYIVARYDWQQNEDETLSEEQMLNLHTNAYNQLHYTYSVQLHMSIDTVRPTLKGGCPLCQDENTYFNPEAMALAVREELAHVPTYEVPPTGRVGSAKGLFASQLEAQRYQYQWAYRKALAESRRTSSSQAMMNEKCLNLLAAYCQEEGLEMELCIEMTCWKKAYWDQPDHVRLVFMNVYDEELSALIPFGHVEKSALLMMRIEAYLNARYQLRRNTLTGVVEYRRRGAYDYGYVPLTEQAMNSMTTGALKMGLQSWDKDLRRIVNSDDVPFYDPLEDYLLGLPCWDGRDHVAAFCRRIPSDTPRYDYYLRIWLRSMVAHWLGKDRLHGNALVPLLIGDQGCGKTSLCSMLLPSELRIYFNDRIDFRSEGDIMSALSNYALINIDEFDSLKKSQQPLLKYLLTKAEVRFRPPYGKAIVERRRYASFIATTNLQHPLRDRTGSRRFACILIRQGEQIDFTTPLDHEQLFAQLLDEVNRGERYWLDDEETAFLQQQNIVFQYVGDLGEMISLTLTTPMEEVAKDSWKSMDEIVTILRRHFPTLEPTRTLSRDVGSLLSQKGFESKRSRSGVRYCIVEK